MRNRLTRQGPLRILAIALFLFVFSQMWAQVAMEIRFPVAFNLGSFCIVLFYTPDTPETKMADSGRPAGD